MFNIRKSYLVNRTSTYLLIVALLFASCSSDTLFKKIETGIDFENKLTESDKENILSYEYFYNGAGLAAADFNNDGKTDLFFVGNQVPNKLYLNEGNLKFKDVSATAKIEGRKGGWRTGVSIADVNQDGFLDIYVCYSGNTSPENRKNELFINCPPTKNRAGVTFIEQAKEYGLDDAGYSTQATFLDYDLDGDLDLFVINHNLKGYERKEAAAMKASVDANAGDRLYRNEAPPVESSNRPDRGAKKKAIHFKDVTQQAGIKSNPLGFGLGVVVSDFNQDNYPDLYVANDYVEEDYLYLNNQNGTFRETGKESMGHFSYSSMGVDAADFNNDGLTDLFTADMLPEDNKRQKLLAFPDNWNVQLSMLDNGFHWQNMRNMLQVNQGVISHQSLVNRKQNKTLTTNDQRLTTFSELAQLAGVASTDWSWAPLFADFDNDGNKDLFVSNGFVRDLTDLDFVKYFLDQENRTKNGEPSETLLQQAQKMPSTPTHHYIFKNSGNLTFENKVKDWGFEQNTTASGAVYADLDQDGDLDLVTNNTNSPATIYKNFTQEKTPKNYLKIALKGSKENVFGIGAKVILYQEGKQQFLEQNPVRGFQSAMIEPLHFGLGDSQKVDSVCIIWQDGKRQSIKNPKLNTLLAVNYSAENALFANTNTKNNSLFSSFPIAENWTGATENFSIDFNRQILLPKLYSRTNPRFAQGDINADGLEDFFVCTPKGQTNAFFIQKPDGTWQEKKMPILKNNLDYEDIDANLVDIDGDKDLDLLVLSGGYEQVLEDKIFQDRLFLNDGKGNFQPAPKNAFPEILTNKSRLKHLDYDKDGDQDFLILGAVRAGLFPYSDPTLLLKNNGKGIFTVTQKFELGLTTDVAVADLNKDGFQDLMIVGEFMPIQILMNQKGHFADKAQNPFENSEGWYNRILANDLDNDGDVDFVLGNIGLNTPFRASKEKPIELFYGDIDQNGTIDPYMSKYFGEKSYLIAGRDEALEQVPSLKRRFTDYKLYSESTTADFFGEEANKMQKLPIYQVESGILWNNEGKLSWQALPLLAQSAPIHAILVNDFNKDGIKDLLLAGNESNFRIRIGKTDANTGLLLLGKKDKTFQALTPNQSGISLKGDIRDAILINNQLIFGANNGKLQGLKSNYEFRMTNDEY